MQVSVTRGWTALSATRTTARFSVRPATAGDWALKVTGLVRGPGLSARTVRTLESSESRHSRQAKFEVSVVGMARPPVGGRDVAEAWRLPRARAAQHVTATCTTQTRCSAPPPPPRHLLDCSRSSLKAGSGISSASSAASALASWTPVLPVTVRTTSCTAMVALPPCRLRTDV